MTGRKEEEMDHDKIRLAVKQICDLFEKEVIELDIAYAAMSILIRELAPQLKRQGIEIEVRQMSPETPTTLQ